MSLCVLCLCGCVSFPLSFSFGSPFVAIPIWPFGDIEGMGDQEVDLSETAVV